MGNEGDCGIEHAGGKIFLGRRQVERLGGGGRLNMGLSNYRKVLGIILDPLRANPVSSDIAENQAETAVAAFPALQPRSSHALLPRTLS
jgi:hypothetical protein